MTATKNFIDFINDLKKAEQFTKIGPAIAFAKPGNWQGIVNLGKYYGYEFSLSEVHSVMKDKPHAFRAIPNDSPLAGWNLDSLTKALEKL